MTRDLVDLGAAADASSGPPSVRDGQSPISRRAALRLMGLSVAAVAPLPFFHSAIAAAQAMHGPIHNAPQTSGAMPGMQMEGAATDQRLRRWTMVIDLRKCDGCQSVDKPPQCSQACIEGHFAPQPMEWIQVFEADAIPGKPQEGTFFQPVPCQQCQNPPCTNVCPVGATFSTPEGTVLIDQDRCIGCRICMAACPYDRRFFNWGKPPQPSEAQLGTYSPEHQAPARMGTVMKCDFCPDMARAGQLPFCAQACPNNAIYYGDLEEGLASNGKEVVDVYRLIVDQHATRLKEDLGTEPRVYYIPGHGEDVGRDTRTMGRKPTEWKWQDTSGGARWQR
jgi:Fe-S-cluster-containing dehydrogenase component